MPIALQALTAAEFPAAVPPVTIEEARKLVSAVTRGDDLSKPVVGVRRVSMDAIRAHGHVPRLEVAADEASALDPFRKLLLRGEGGEAIETVRIPLERTGRFSVCVSSQVGCALGCAFCATGRLGLKRNLQVWEIVEQVRLVRGTLDRPAGQRIHGVVFQGMGEPMANLDRVLAAIRVFSEPSGLAIDQRNVTVCTAGLPAGIRRLAKEAPRVRLGLSIGSARPEVRRRLMPIEAAHTLVEVLAAAEEHAQITGISPLFAITPLAGVNDHDEDAKALAALVQGFVLRTGVRPRLSVIPYNAISEVDDPFVRPTEEAFEGFRDALRREGVATHRRYSGGSDIGAACGQLAGRSQPAP